MLPEIVKQIIIAFGLSSYYTVSSNKQQASHAEPSAEKAMGKKLYSTRSALDLMSKAQCEKTMREKADKIAEKVMSAFQQYSLRNEFEIWAEEGSLPLPPITTGTTFLKLSGKTKSLKHFSNCISLLAVN